MDVNKDNVKTFSDLLALASVMGWDVDEDLEGGIVIYTNLREGDGEKLVPVDCEDE